MLRQQVVILLLLLQLAPSHSETFAEALGSYVPFGGVTAKQAQSETEEETVTEVPMESSTWNRFNEAGWRTDANGNVYVGNDLAKLYLISVGSFWPFPKDYRRK